jgi:hypothetical protein
MNSDRDVEPELFPDYTPLPPVSSPPALAVPGLGAFVLTPGAYTEKRRADFSKFLFVLIPIDIKMIKKGI